MLADAQGRTLHGMLPPITSPSVAPSALNRSQQQQQQQAAYSPPSKQASIKESKGVRDVDADLRTPPRAFTSSATSDEMATTAALHAAALQTLSVQTGMSKYRIHEGRIVVGTAGVLLDGVRSQDTSYIADWPATARRDLGAGSPRTHQSPKPHSPSPTRIPSTRAFSFSAKAS